MQTPPQSSRSRGPVLGGCSPSGAGAEPALPADPRAEERRTPRRPLPPQDPHGHPFRRPGGFAPPRAPARLPTAPGAGAPGQPRGGRGAPLALPVQEAPGRAGRGCTVPGARPRPQRTARPGLQRRRARRGHSPPGTGEKVARGGAAARTVTPQRRPLPGLRAAAGPAPPHPAPLPCPGSRPRGSTSGSGCSGTRFTSAAAVGAAIAAGAAGAAGPSPPPSRRRAAAAAATPRSPSCARPRCPDRARRLSAPAEPCPPPALPPPRPRRLRQPALGPPRRAR